MNCIDCDEDLTGEKAYSCEGCGEALCYDCYYDRSESEPRQCRDCSMDINDSIEEEYYCGISDELPLDEIYDFDQIVNSMIDDIN